MTRLHIRPAVAELRIGEATTQRLDKVITKITENAGPSTAKTARAIISGAMSLAVRYGAIAVNPTREIEAIEAAPKNPPKALTAEEVTLLRTSLAADHARSTPSSPTSSPSCSAPAGEVSQGPLMGARPRRAGQGLLATRNTGHPISVRQAALSSVSRGPTR
ncbi:hypothetical protein ABZS29_26390 [Kribbella sp. NPDC005582]|uniref:hypothetical protein n=1 Tax=Kribbella sp. NPDC005582 TaxID=3156893 RepID=UPI0033A8F206